MGNVGALWCIMDGAMTDLLSILAFGFWLGMRHATDGDHVAAVAAIVSRRRKFGSAWLLGAVWGLGHSVTVLFAGAAIIVLKFQIPPRLGLALEFGVGLLLMGLGLLNMTGERLGSGTVQVHSHPHDHRDSEHRHEEGPEGGAHAHVHLHGPALGRWKAAMEGVGRIQIFRSLFVGFAHGLAGSAAVALLAVSAISSPRAAGSYLLIFGLGTTLGMLILSAVMEYSMTFLARWWKSAGSALIFGTGLLSFLFGLYVAYQTGWERGLFGAQVDWTPH